MSVNDFSGEFRFTLDTKKRISIPAGIRKMLPPEAEGALVFTRGFEGCVYVYTNDEWKRLTEKLNSLDSFNVNVRNFTRLFIGNAHKVVMDNQGRVLLPEQVINLAEIERDIVWLGSLNKWEMWNPEKYREYVESNGLTMEGLAEQINFSAMFNSSE